MTTAKDAWLAIESESPARPGIARRRVYATAAPDIHAGVDGRSRARLFQLEVDAAAAPGPEQLLQATGFSMELTPGSRQGRVSITVTAGAMEFSDVFAVLTDDVLLVTSQALAENEAVASFFDRLRVWHFFFTHGGRGALEPQQRRGLVGELLFLEKLFDYTGEASAIDFWVGPLGSDHDFEAMHWSVEVKTTGGKPPYSVTVSNVRQLDPRLDERLAVVVFVLEETASAAAPTLPDLVERLRGRLAGSPLTAAKLQFDGKLIAAGYLDVHRPLYRERFAVRERLAFGVEAGFPRLREAALPKGVGDVRYSLVLDACATFSLSEDELRARLR